MTPDVERFYRSVLEHVDEAVVTTSVDARVTYLNPAAERLYGMRQDDAVGRSLLELLAEASFPEDVRGVRGVIDVLAERGAWRGEIEYPKPSGHCLVLDVSAAYLRDADGGITGSVTVARDITRRKELEAEIIRSATHDPLTDLLNRAALTRALGDALAHDSRRAAVAFIDLNGFKAINDSFGHEAGDEVLVNVAARLRRAIRPTDRAARFGGDEFVVLLRDVADEADAARLVDRFAAEVEQPITSRRSGTHRVGASIGIAVARADDTVESLLRRADAAMYNAKRSSNVRTSVR